MRRGSVEEEGRGERGRKGKKEGPETPIKYLAPKYCMAHFLILLRKG